MRTLIVGDLRGDLELAEALLATQKGVHCQRVVLGNLFGTDREKALATAKWLAANVGPEFHALLGDEDVGLLWPSHWRCQDMQVPDWGPDVRDALGDALALLRFIDHVDGVWLTHAGLTVEVVTGLEGLTPERALRENVRVHQALDDNAGHYFLNPRTGVLDSEWQKTPWLPNVLQAIAYRHESQPASFRHPNYASGVVHLGGTGYAVIRNGQQVALNTLGIPTRTPAP